MKLPRFLAAGLASTALFARAAIAAGTEYTITTTGGAIVITDDLGFSDVLEVAQPAAGVIRFSVGTTRTFTVNGGGPVSVSFVDALLSGITSVTVNAGAGSDTINVGSFGRGFPGLTLNGGTGDDTVNLDGDLIFAADGSLDLDLQNDAAAPGLDTVNVAAGAKVIASYGGSIAVKCSRSVSLSSGATLETQHGVLLVEANQQVTATPGDFVGVKLDGVGTMLRATGSGALIVKGRGGDAPSGSQFGVQVNAGASIIGGTLAVSFFPDRMFVAGLGGSSIGPANRGVIVRGPGSAITSAGAWVYVQGIAGAVGSSSGVGVSVRNGGEISAGGAGLLYVEGVGAGASSSGNNMGVEVSGFDSRIISDQEGITVEGTAGPGVPSGASGSWGLFMDDSAEIAMLPAGIAHIGIHSDSVSLDSTASIIQGSVIGWVYFWSKVAIDLGGADTVGTLGLSDAELDRVNTGGLSFANFEGGDITISAPITRTMATNVNLYPLSASGKLRASGSGTDLSVGNGVVHIESALAMPITGGMPDTGFPQLKIAGHVQLSSPLELAGTTLPGAVGNTFTIVDNDGPDAIDGTFRNLPEGAALSWPGDPLLRARISYVGGTGNDVVLTLTDEIEVTNTDDSGPGSLRDAFAVAAAKPGADLITFHPALYGVIILAGEIVVNEPTGPVTVDAHYFPGGMTVYGGPGANRVFSVATGSTVHLRGLKLSGGDGAGAANSGRGGAIYNAGVVSLTDCTLESNRAQAGGAIYSIGAGSSVTALRCLFSSNTAQGTDGGGAIVAGTGTQITATDSAFFAHLSTTTAGAVNLLTGSSAIFKRCTFEGNSTGDAGAVRVTNATLLLDQCTLSGNYATSQGGALYAAGNAITLRHCTVAGNYASHGGGVRLVSGNLTVENSIVAGNTAEMSGPDFRQTGGAIGRSGSNVVGINTSVAAVFVAGAPNAFGEFVGSAASPVDALLAPLGNYGGPTLTMALRAGSPARDHSSGSAISADQRGFPIIGVADVGAYEAGTIANYATWAWETLPTTATADERAPGFDLDTDTHNNALEFATFTDGGVPDTTALLVPTLNAAGNEATLVIPYRFGIPGLRYHIDRSTTLLAWDHIATLYSGSNNTPYLAPRVTLTGDDAVSVTIADATLIGQPGVFYRLRIELAR